jgi:osmoprotectant transport system permease protein
MTDFLAQHGVELLYKAWQQLYISAIAIVLGMLVAIPLGVVLTRVPRVAKVVIGFTSMLQTVPSLALLALMIPLFGIGQIPAIIALFIYSLLPILRNTYLGMEGVSESLIDVAKGMGMTRMQSVLQVQIPFALPVIMTGVRLAAVYVIAWATLASYIGAGGLGDFIFSGLNLYQPAFIIGGTIPVMIMALAVDWSLGRLEQKLTPINLRKAAKS